MFLMKSVSALLCVCNYVYVCVRMCVYVCVCVCVCKRAYMCMRAYMLMHLFCIWLSGYWSQDCSSLPRYGFG